MPSSSCPCFLASVFLVIPSPCLNWQTFLRDKRSTIHAFSVQIGITKCTWLPLCLSRLMPGWQCRLGSSLGAIWPVPISSHSSKMPALDAARMDWSHGAFRFPRDMPNCRKPPESVHYRCRVYQDNHLRLFAVIAGGSSKMKLFNRPLLGCFK